MKILITGASGYVGRILTQHFSRSHQVLATARDISKILVPNTQRQNLDVLSLRQVQDTIRRTAPDLVIHAAALPKRSTATHEDFIRTNVEGANNIALATEQCSDAKYIMISSGCAFTQTPRKLITLDSPRSSSSAFACSKNIAEIEARQIFTTKPHRLAIVYPPVILHPSQTEGIIPASVREATNTHIITNKVPYGHLNFVHHARFSQLLEAIAGNENASTVQQYLLTGNRFTTVDFFRKLQRLFLTKLRISSTIHTSVDHHLETMCESYEGELYEKFPGFQWDDIDDVILDIAQNNLNAINTTQTYTSTNRIISRLEQATSNLSWIPANKEALKDLDKSLSIQEKEFIESAQTQFSKVFLETRKQMLKSKRVDGDFPYPLYEPVLKRLILNLTMKFETELSINSSAIRKLRNEGIALLEDKIPYKKTMRFIAGLLDEIDSIFLQRNPSLTSNFHRKNAEHVLETLINAAPDILLFPSFQSVDIDFFINTRPSPFHIVGINLNGFEKGEAVPYADGFPMKPSEFYWHDIGHIEFMQDKDNRFIKGSFKPIERIIPEWNFTCRRIAEYLKSIESRNLLDATKLILFEILHERGFQYSLAVLKAELDTPKWTEILTRKHNNNYYQNSPEINLALFTELENARTNLLHFIEDLRCRDLKKIHRCNAWRTSPLTHHSFP